MVKFVFSKEKIKAEGVSSVAGQLGQMLVEARENAHLSQKELAERLYVFSDLIDKIEKEDFDQLPQLTKSHLKGFLKRYSEVTGINSEAVSDLFDQIYQEPEIQKKISDDIYVDISKTNLQKKSFLKIRFLLIGVTIILLSILFFSSFFESQNISDYQTIILPN